MKTLLFQSNEDDFPNPFSITVSNLCTVSKLKEIAASISNISASDLVFFHENKELLDEDQVTNINESNSIIFVTQRNRLNPNSVAYLPKEKSNLLQNFTPKAYFDKPQFGRTFSDNDEHEEEFSNLLNLKISLYNGKVAHSRCTSTTTALQAKTILSSLLNLNHSEPHFLYYQGKKLNDEIILSHILHDSNSNFYFGPNPPPSSNSHNLTINIVDGTVAKTKFTDTATIGKMKEVLAQQFNTSPRNISVIVDDPNASDDSMYIKDLNLEAGNVLYTSISPTHQIKITLSNGKTIKGSFNNMATIGTVKSVLANTFGLPINDLYIPNSIVDDSTHLIELDENNDGNCKIEIFSSLFFKTNDGKLIKTRFKETATIKKAKTILAQQLGVSFDDIYFDLPKHIGHDTLIKDLSLQNNTINVLINEELHNRNESLIGNKRYAIDGTENMKRISFVYEENGTKINGRFSETANFAVVRNTISKIFKISPVDILLLYNNDILLDHQLISSLSLSTNDFILIKKRNIPY